MRALSSLASVLFVLLLAAPAGAAVSSSHSGWLWGTPEPQGFTLRAIDMQGTTGYAAGEFGTLLRTNDGGGEWAAVRTGETVFEYLDVEVIDADSVVVGSLCTLRRTDNGGQTFTRLPFTPSERRCARSPEALSFPTAQVGYVLTGDGAVLRTEDGGRSFSSQAVPGGGGFLRDLMFRNANDGLAVTTGGDIFRTVDGGDSWTREFDGDVELLGVLFTGSEAVAVGIGARFLTSSDGGDTWTRPAAEPGAPDPPTVDFVDVRCASPTTCLMTTRSGDFFGGSTLYRTADGGRSFSSTAVSGVTAADYASATRAVAVGVAGRTQLSDDAGANFTQLGSRIETVGGGAIQIRALSRNVVHAAGEQGTLARTVDGGETWINIGVPTAAFVRDLWFATESVGYALADGLFRTENGGGSWSILEAGTDASPNGVFAPDASNVFLIGPRGVLRSRDAGDTFEPHTHRVIRNRTLVGADEAGSDVVFYGPRVIALSTNGGSTWRHIPRPAGRHEVRDVDFVSSRVGYVLMTGGRIYVTRNRGASWTELIGVGYSQGVQLAFGDARNGWLSLGIRRPSLLRTTDGGKSWTPQIIGPSGPHGIAAAGSQTGFATQFSGILFTQDGGGAGADSTLRLSTADRTPQRGQKIAIRGTLSSADGGEDVEVRVRRLTSSRWREIDVFPRANGQFVIERRIRRTLIFVAQWEGDPNSDGDGTRALVVRPH